MILNATVNRIVIEAQTLPTGQRTTNWYAVVRNRIVDFNYAITKLQSSMSDINIFSTEYLYDRPKLRFWFSLVLEISIS